VPSSATHRCKYLLRWTKEHKRFVYCNHDVLRKNIMLEPKELLDGCPEGCEDFEPRWPLEAIDETHERG
jgi:hypothetical protein